jgi:hypothetical protein
VTDIVLKISCYNTQKKNFKSLAWNILFILCFEVVYSSFEETYPQGKTELNDEGKKFCDKLY